MMTDESPNVEELLHELATLVQDWREIRDGGMELHWRRDVGDGMAHVAERLLHVLRPTGSGDADATRRTGRVVDRAHDDQVGVARASADQVRQHAAAIRAAAHQVGATDVRMLDDGTVVIHSDDPGYRHVIALSALATQVVGSYVHVITDDAPGAKGARPLGD